MNEDFLLSFGMRLYTSKKVKKKTKKQTLILRGIKCGKKCKRRPDGVFCFCFLVVFFSFFRDKNHVVINLLEKKGELFTVYSFQAKLLQY